MKDDVARRTFIASSAALSALAAAKGAMPGRETSAEPGIRVRFLGGGAAHDGLELVLG